MLALLLRADGNHRFFVNALFGTPEAGIPVENYSDGEDAPAKLLPWLERDKPLGIDKNWPARVPCSRLMGAGSRHPLTAMLPPPATMPAP